MSDNAYRAKKLADLHMVVHDARSTKAEIKWAACEAMALLEQAHERLKLASPLIEAVEAIAWEAARSASGDPQ